MRRIRIRRKIFAEYEIADGEICRIRNRRKRNSPKTKSPNAKFVDSNWPTTEQRQHFIIMPESFYIIIISYSANFAFRQFRIRRFLPSSNIFGRFQLGRIWIRRNAGKPMILGYIMKVSLLLNIIHIIR